MSAHPSIAVGAGWNAGTGRIVRPSTTRGGTLRLVSAADVDSLDPARTYYVWVWLLNRMLNRTLMAYPTDAGPAGLTPVPDLAAGPPEVSDGFRTWTYRLRRGVRYHDGTEVTAQHVRHGVQRAFARDVLPGGPTTIIPLLDDPERPHPGPYLDPDGLPAVQVLDDHTIVFRLRRPFPDFDHLLAQPATGPVPPAADTGARYGDDPRCSGPYRIASYQPGQRLLLERNPYWDRSSDPLRPALVDQVDVTFGVDLDELDDGLLAGRWDLCLEGRGIQHAAQQRIMADPQLQANADNPETNFLQYVSLQPQVPPLGNIHARRAIHHAADRVRLQEARGGPVTGGGIATQLIPARFASHGEWERYGTGPDRRGDLPAARRELAAAGLPDGFEATIGTQRGKFRLVADALAESVARVGIRLDVVELDVASYFSRGVGSPETIRRLGLALAVTDWGADFPTEYGFLAPLVDSRLIAPAGGNWNLAELRDPEIDGWIDASLEAPDLQQRAQLWRRVERRVMDRAVILPIVHDRTLHYRNPWLTNIFVHPAFGLYDVQAIGLQPAPKEEETP